MRLIKNVFIFTGVLLCAHSFAQEQTVEQKALTPGQVRQLKLIDAHAKGSRDQKETALQSIENDFLSKKLMNAEVQQIVEELATEGIRNKVRSEGRVSNNFWQVRKDAIRLLGEFTFDNTDPETAKATEDALMQIAQDDTYPDNVAAAFKSLGNIAGSDPDPERAKRAVNTIDFIFRDFDSASAPPTGSVTGPTGDDILATQFIWTVVGLATKGVLKDDSETFKPIIQSIRDIAAGGGDGYGQKDKYSGKVKIEARKALKILQRGSD